MRFHRGFDMELDIAFLQGFILFIAIANIWGIGFTLYYCFNMDPLHKHENVPLLLGGIITLLGVTLVAPDRVLVFQMPSSVYWFMGAIPLGILIIFGEYLITQLIRYYKLRKWSFRISVHSIYSGSKTTFSRILIIVSLVVLEEVLIRQALIMYINLDTSFSIVSAVLISAIAYSTNHSAFGLSGMLIKFMTGIVYSIIYILSNYSVLVVVMVHTTQNLGLLALANYIQKRSSL